MISEEGWNENFEAFNAVVTDPRVILAEAVYQVYADLVYKNWRLKRMKCNALRTFPERVRDQEVMLLF